MKYSKLIASTILLSIVASVSTASNTTHTAASNDALLLDPDGLLTGNKKGKTYWGGPNSLVPSCAFSNIVNGQMNVNADNSWSTSSPATVTVDYRNISQIDIDPQNGGEIEQVNGSAVFAAAIDYNGSTVSALSQGNWSAGGENFELTGLNNGLVNIGIEISATPTATVPVVYDANTTYRVRHVITCTQ